VQRHALFLGREANPALPLRAASSRTPPAGHRLRRRPGTRSTRRRTRRSRRAIRPRGPSEGSRMLRR